MKKIIKLNEKDIESLVEKILKEDLPRKEMDRKSTNFKKSEFDPYERESGLKSVFGSYGDDIPPSVIQYMRKNPALIIKRLEKLYGRDEILRYLGE